MKPLREWPKAPRTLLVILYLLTLASVSALGWVGWRLLDQERLVEAQRSQERLQQAAGQITAGLRGWLAETGERVGAREKPGEGLLLLFDAAGVRSLPANQLLFYPFPARDPEAPDALFAEAERFEFQENRPESAFDAYRRLAGSTRPAARAGALLRMARVLRNSGRIEESRVAYKRLAAVSSATVAGVPAELAARHALCELDGTRADAEALANDLQHGRWRLSRGQFAFYWWEAARLAGRETPPPAEAMALSEAAALAWNAWQRDPSPRGEQTLWIGGRPYFLMWRGSQEERSVLVTTPAAILQRLPACEEVHCAAADAEGRQLAGQRRGSGPAAVLTAAETQLPWTFYITPAHPLSPAGLLARQRFLLLGLSVMVLFLVLGTYFIGRAIRRETEVLRMQSDFVSAVSHEFRSPLTSMRQLSEILALGRAPSEERRQVYYETLVRETSRLQRLVESLLNFGRMEAGARQYRFEELDAGALVRRVAAEFEPQAVAAGRSIELHPASVPCLIEADPEAISVALRNLVDNALKYSPESPTVWVEWEREAARVAIRVRDRGAGIANSERKAIFRKFVRGSAAAAGNVKGSGVGLAMVRHIVAAHGGEIRMISKLGEGSTFTMLLPAVEST